MPTKWVPGGFPGGVSLIAQLTLFSLMLVRGMDYAAGDAPSTAHRLGSIEAAAPLPMWGAIFLIAACVGFSSLSLQSSWGIISAHIVGWVTYWTFGAGLLMDVVSRRPIADFDPTVPAVAIFPVATVAFCCVWAAKSRWKYGAWVAGGCLVAMFAGLVTVEYDGLRNASVLIGIGTMHVVYASGIAAKLRQEDIRATRSSTVDQCKH